MRLPVGQNQKPRGSGHFNHVVEYWNPAIRYTLEDAAAVFGIDLDELKDQLKPSPPNRPSDSVSLPLATSRRCWTCSIGSPSCNDCR